MSPSGAPPMSMYAMSDGCRIAARLEGPDQAPVIVLASSLGTSHRMWQPQLAELTRSCRVLQLDTRGHGASDAPPGDYTIERLGRDMIEVLDALGLGRVHVCGLSLGGFIAQWVAAHAPERVDRLVLANTAPVLGPRASWDERIAIVQRDGVAALVDGILARWFTPAFHGQDPDAIGRVRAMLLATSPVGYAGCSAALRDGDLRATAARIAAPTLLITGTADPVTPPDRAEELASLIRDSRVVALPAAHLSNVEQADAFTHAVLEHLS